MRYAFPYVAKPEPEGGFFASFPDVPEALSRVAMAADVPDMARA